jgi:ring-1,2-phenylacetyl-CoA epoxidase subunit PaaA
MPEPIRVENPEQFRKMPSEYQELLVHQLRAHTEGELTGADDYIQIFYPMAPNAYERRVCCERAAEEMDHYIRGAKILTELGVETAYMLAQNIESREFYRTEGVRRIGDWVGRGLFSFVGEAAVLAIIEEMRESSYLPVGEMAVPVIIDEHGHVAHGYRIVKDLCRTKEGRARVQETLPRAWAVSLDLFGKSDSERSRRYVQWGLRKYTNDEARQRYIEQTVPKVEALGLEIPDVAHLRKFM